MTVRPELAGGDEIVAVPTLVRKLPEPMRKIIGDLSDTSKVLVGLQLRERGHGMTGDVHDPPADGVPDSVAYRLVLYVAGASMLSTNAIERIETSVIMSSRAGSNSTSSMCTKNPTGSVKTTSSRCPLLRKLPAPLRRSSSGTCRPSGFWSRWTCSRGPTRADLSMTDSAADPAGESSRGPSMKTTLPRYGPKRLVSQLGSG